MRTLSELLQTVIKTDKVPSVKGPQNAQIHHDLFRKTFLSHTAEGRGHLDRRYCSCLAHAVSG